MNFSTNGFRPISTNWETGTNEFGKWVLLNNHFLKSEYIEDFLELSDELKDLLCKIIQKGGMQENSAGTLLNGLLELNKFGFVWRTKTITGTPVFAFNYKIFQRM